MKYQLNSKTTNTEILNSEIDFEYEGICGTEYGVTWEESLEEFFRDNDINVIDVRYVKEPIIGEDCEISNAEYGEELGNAKLEQNGRKFIVPIFCGQEGCSVYNETFNFNFIKEV